MSKNLFVTLSICCSLLAGLSGCSMIQDDLQQAGRENAAQAPKPTATIPKFEEHLHEWQDIKPGIERLVAIEGELTELIDQLNSIITENEAAKQQAATSKQQQSQDTLEVAVAEKAKSLPEMTKKSAAVVSPKPAAKQITSSAASAYTLQLYSLSNQQQVRPTWYKLQHKHPAILGKLKAIFEKIKIKQNTFYRVKAGKFSDSYQADEMCSRLKALGTQCIPTEYKGQPLSELSGS